MITQVTDMKITDDTVLRIMMDTNTKVTENTSQLRTIKDDIQIIKDCNRDQEERIKHLEENTGVGPLNKDAKYWGKKLAPWTAGLSLLIYIIYDLYTSLKGG